MPNVAIADQALALKLGELVLTNVRLAVTVQALQQQLAAKNNELDTLRAELAARKSNGHAVNEAVP